MWCNKEMLPGHKKLQIVEAFQRRPFIVRKECICEVSFLLQFWSCMSAFPPASRFQHFSSIRREFGVSCNRRECYKVLSVRCSSFTVGVRHLVSRQFEVERGRARRHWPRGGLLGWQTLASPLLPRQGRAQTREPEWASSSLRGSALRVGSFFLCPKRLCSAQVLSSVCPCLAGPDSKDELIWITRSYFHLVWLCVFFSSH